jgi:hypothetical protein
MGARWSRWHVFGTPRQPKQMQSVQSVQSSAAHLPFAIRHSPFAIRHLPFAICLGPNAHTRRYPRKPSVMPLIGQHPLHVIAIAVVHCLTLPDAPHAKPAASQAAVVALTPLSIPTDTDTDTDPDAMTCHDHSRGPRFSRHGLVSAAPTSPALFSPAT